MGLTRQHILGFWPTAVQVAGIYVLLHAFHPVSPYGRWTRSDAKWAKWRDEMARAQPRQIAGSTACERQEQAARKNCQQKTVLSADVPFALSCIARCSLAAKMQQLTNFGKIQNLNLLYLVTCS